MGSKDTLLATYTAIPGVTELKSHPNEYSIVVSGLLIGSVLNQDPDKNPGSRTFGIAARDISTRLRLEMEKLRISDPDVYITGYATRHIQPYTDLLQQVTDSGRRASSSASELIAAKHPMIVNLVNTALEARLDVINSLIAFGNRASFNLEHAVKGKRNQHDIYHAEYWAVWNATNGK